MYQKKLTMSEAQYQFFFDALRSGISQKQIYDKDKERNNDLSRH